MDENEGKLTDIQKEAVKFLERDFNQCFQQMRHYDLQIFDSLKFMFGAYTALTGVSIGLYQFGVKEGKDFSGAAIAALLVGLVIGIYMYALIVRNRVYFVGVTRYVNENRGFFLKQKPLGFENKSKMYTNHSQPPYFNLMSSHSWLCYLCALLNGILMGVLLYISSIHYCVIVLAFTAFFFIQVILAVTYLRTRENKSTAKAVFGSD